MDDELLKIYSLMKTAEDQLKALQEASLGLKAERAAIAQERARLEKTLMEQAQSVKTAAASLKTVGAAIRQDAKEITPALQEAVQEAVGATMRQTLSLTATHIVKTLETASEPILRPLTEVAEAAKAAEASLRNAGQWFAWKWIGLAAGMVGAILVTAILALQQIERLHWRSLTERQENLTRAVTQLQAAAEALDKRTHGLFVVSGSDGVFLITPKGSPLVQCRAGPCIRLQDAAR